MLLATALVLLFVVLDVAVTQTNFATLITLGGQHESASNEAARAAIVAAATYATTVLSSTVGVYSIVVLALAEVLIGLVTLKANLSRAAAYLAVAAGSLGLVSVAGPLVVSWLSGAIIISSILTTAWVIVVGYRLYARSRRGDSRLGLPVGAPSSGLGGRVHSTGDVTGLGTRRTIT